MTVHLMSPELDTGPILRQRRLEIDPAETALGLQLRLTEAGGEELLAALKGLPGSIGGRRRAGSERALVLHVAHARGRARAPRTRAGASPACATTGGWATSSTRSASDSARPTARSSGSRR